MNLKKITESENRIIKNIVLSYISNHTSDKLKYFWKIKGNWNELGLNFNHNDFKSDDEKRIAAKKHVAKIWYSLDNHERFRVASWIIKDWGGIRGNKDETISNYVSFSLEKQKNFLFKGVSSYSKILSFTNPDKFAIYDARVASSLNCLLLEGRSNKFLFPIPDSQNRNIKPFRKHLLKDEVINRKFLYIENFYETYLDILEKISLEIGQSIDYVEGILFTDTENLIHKKAISSP